jgi:HSP20 family protein
MSTIVLRRPARVARTAELLAPFATPFAAPAYSARGLSAPAFSAPAGPLAHLGADGEDGILTIEAPGLDPAADLSVTLTGRTLTVTGVRRSVTRTGNVESRFSRSVSLPEGVSADAVSADYSAGILRVRIAGLYPAPVVPETVHVSITSDVAPASAVAVAATDPSTSDGAATDGAATDGAATDGGTTDRS